MSRAESSRLKQAPMISTLLCASILSNQSTPQPLTLEQIVQKLNSVPVFVITNDKGHPITSSMKGKTVVAAFLSVKDAQTFLEETKKAKKLPEADLATVKVSGIPLGDMYRRTKLVGEGKINLGLIGSSNEQPAADAEARKLDPKSKGFELIPLYAGKVKGSGYLTFSQGGKSVVPLFFSRADLQAKIDESVKAKPEMAGKIDIELTSLEGIITLMESADKKQTEPLGFVLLPEIRSLLSSGRQGG